MKAGAGRGGLAHKNRGGEGASAGVPLARVDATTCARLEGLYRYAPRPPSMLHASVKSIAVGQEAAGCADMF